MDGNLKWLKRIMKKARRAKKRIVMTVATRTMHLDVLDSTEKLSLSIAGGKLTDSARLGVHR